MLNIKVGKWKHREMMNLSFQSKVFHLYDNGNWDTATFLKINVDVDRNEATITKGKVPLEIN